MAAWAGVTMKLIPLENRFHAITPHNAVLQVRVPLKANQAAEEDPIRPL